MTTPKTVIATVTRIERCKRLSTNGNPSYDIHTDAGVFRTQTDSSLGYSLPNYENSRRENAYIIGKPVRLVMTKANRVYDVTWPDGSRID